MPPKKLMPLGKLLVWTASLFRSYNISSINVLQIITFYCQQKPPKSSPSDQVICFFVGLNITASLPLWEVFMNCTAWYVRSGYTPSNARL